MLHAEVSAAGTPVSGESSPRSSSSGSSKERKDKKDKKDKNNKKISKPKDGKAQGRALFVCMAAALLDNSVSESVRRNSKDPIALDSLYGEYNNSPQNENLFKCSQECGD